MPRRTRANSAPALSRAARRASDVICFLLEVLLVQVQRSYPSTRPSLRSADQDKEELGLQRRVSFFDLSDPTPSVPQVSGLSEEESKKERCGTRDDSRIANPHSDTSSDPAICRLADLRPR